MSLRSLLVVHAVLFLSVFSAWGDDGLNQQTWYYGNTWPGGPLATRQWMVHAMDNFMVRGDRIYGIAHWEEGGGEANIYTAESKFFRRLEGWHSWGFHGGQAVAADEQYVYYGMGHNFRDGGGTNYAGVARYTLAGDPAPFEGAAVDFPEKNAGNANQPTGFRLQVNDDNAKVPTGLAVVDGELFVADPANNRIVVYSTRDLKQVRQWAIHNPGRLVVDAGPQHALWMLDSAGKSIIKIGRDGKDMGVKITDVKQPTALCIDRKTGDLLVADSADDRMHIRRYRADTGAHIDGKDFGQPIWKGPKPGEVGPGRFTKIVGIDTDEAGNLYVADSDSGARLFKFAPDGKEQWVLKGLEFVSCGDADPQEPTSVYSTRRRYELDYSKGPGEGWREAAVTLDPLRYPQDPRRCFTPEFGMRMYRLGGQKIMLGKQQMSEKVFFWRFNGEIAVPAAMYFPKGLPRAGANQIDNFGARWAGFLVPQTTGKHQIITISDDAVRLWIDGKPVIDHWPSHSPTEDKAEVELEAGKRYAVKMEYCNVSGPGQMRLFWQEPGKEREIIPAKALLANDAGKEHGLTARFFFGTAPSEVPDGHAKQTRIDKTVDYAGFFGALEDPKFGATPPEPVGPAWPNGNPAGPFIWTDNNGDGKMTADEYQTAPEAAVIGQAVAMDDKGDLWANTGGWEAGRGQITRIPFTGVNAHGVPQWDASKVTSKPIPTEGGLQNLSKLHYDPATDRMYIGGFTQKHPYPGGGWEQMSVGLALQCYADWSKTPRLIWEQDQWGLIPESISKIPKAWAFAGDYLFVSYTRKNTQIAVDVFNANDGKRLGMLLSTPTVGDVGWTDMNDCLQATKLKDGRYVVFSEEVMMGKNLYWIWKP